MKKDKTSFISEQRERLQAYIDKTGVSANAISRSLGVSSAQVSQFLNEKYTGDNYAAAEKIAAFLKRQEERIDYNEILTDILPTTNVERVLNLARICHVEGEMGVVAGDAGLSKTTGIKEYTAQNPDGVILIEVVPGFTAKILMSEIHKALKLGGEGTQIRMFQQVQDKLKGSQRLIIIDEAEHLPKSALELTRRIHDMTGIGIVLAGLPKLLENLRGLTSNYRQLYSRIGIAAELDVLQEDDVKMIVQAAIPGSNGLYKKFYKRTDNARALTKVLKRAIQVANMHEVPPSRMDDEVVEEAWQYIII